ncbi:helix-turn-helix transcriptional regulator [Staphylococcus nepalensis]|uniref:helix-turn-helix domain-containing protein n=1 Tax=Staphylococcus nepalensis TaxID=214473 RepID=UPI002B261DFD|nr:helix-turn-helix transcriptional regulator [Staphylococcus nepalensis]WQL21253.1 helix-turn-helix transcriptional regulator [Staphylococcus nepalensis]
MTEVNKYVRKLRKEKGVTQSLISKQTGISLSLISKFDNSKCNISESKLSKIIMMLSSDDDEFKKHSRLIYESFGLQLSNSYSSYGLATYDFNDIDKLAKTFTYGNKPLYDSDITAIKQLAKTLAYKN